jgi:hypothetical protein
VRNGRLHNPEGVREIENGRCDAEPGRQGVLHHNGLVPHLHVRFADRPIRIARWQAEGTYMFASASETWQARTCGESRSSFNTAFAASNRAAGSSRGILATFFEALRCTSASSLRFRTDVPGDSMIRSRSQTDCHVQPNEPLRESFRAVHLRASVDSESEVVIDCTTVREDCQQETALYASGIAWIDRAYEVIRQLRRKHGLPDISPLVEPSHQSDA